MWTDFLSPYASAGTEDQSKIMWGIFVIGTILVLFQVAEVVIGAWVSRQNQSSLEETIIRSLGRFTPLKTDRMVDPTGRTTVDVTALGIPGSAGVSPRVANKNAKIGEPGGVVIDGFATVSQDKLLSSVMNS